MRQLSIIWDSRWDPGIEKGLGNGGHWGSAYEVPALVPNNVPMLASHCGPRTTLMEDATWEGPSCTPSGYSLQYLGNISVH